MEKIEKIGAGDRSVKLIWGDRDVTWRGGDSIIGKGMSLRRSEEVE